MALDSRDVARFERRRNIFDDRKTGKQGEAPEDDGDIDDVLGCGDGAHGRVYYRSSQVRSPTNKRDEREDRVCGYNFMNIR